MSEPDAPSASPAPSSPAPSSPAPPPPAGVRAAAPEPGRVRRTGPKVTYRRPAGRRDRGSRRTPNRSVILAFVIVAVVAAAAMAFALRSPGAEHAAAPATTSGPASPPSFRFTMTAPAKVGTWTTLDDQTAAEPFHIEVTQVGVEHPFAVVYADPAEDSAIVWGGVGSPYAKGTPASRLDTFFTRTARNIGGGSAGPRTDLDPGALGGTAQCTTVAGRGITMVVCGWTGDGALLGFEFSAGTLDQDAPQMTALLAAIVIPAGNH